MCNDYRLMVELASVIEEFEHLTIKIRFPEGRPNIEAREDIKITDTAPIVRTVEGERGVGELVQRRWSWPGPSKKPVYNFRSEGREFSSNRALILCDGFFEFMWTLIDYAIWRGRGCALSGCERRLAIALS
jgi:putative SOS response-associated peptidase YedK